MSGHKSHSMVLQPDGTYRCQKDTPSVCGWRGDLKGVTWHMVQNQPDLTKSENKG